MSLLLIAAMAAASPEPATAPVTTAEHVVHVDHRGARHAVTYRSTMAITHRQIGAVTPPGRPGTMRCLWTATVSVDRQAARDGAPVAALTRRAIGATQFTGSRIGSCALVRHAIAAEMAQRGDHLRDHLTAVAADDHAAVLVEIDDAHHLALGTG